MQLVRHYRIAIRPIAFFRPSEEIDLCCAEKLAQIICDDACWIAPVPVDRESGIVMDGNHRVHAAGLLGLTHLPCFLLDYSDPRVSVFDRETGHPFSVEKIYRFVLNNRILPYKTTRHQFHPALPATGISLATLMPGVST